MLMNSLELTAEDYAVSGLAETISHYILSHWKRQESFEIINAISNDTT